MSNSTGPWTPHTHTARDVDHQAAPSAKRQGSKISKTYRGPTYHRQGATPPHLEPAGPVLQQTAPLPKRHIPKARGNPTEPFNCIWLQDRPQPSLGPRLGPAVTGESPGNPTRGHKMVINGYGGAAFQEGKGVTGASAATSDIILPAFQGRNRHHRGQHARIG